MIERIVIENFKSLRSVDLTLGRVNLFIGTNASGKSNFLEALRVLEGIGNGFTIGEILNGKPRNATNEIWAGIRGGSKYACFSDPVGKDEVTIAAFGGLEGSHPMKWEYRITFSSNKEEIIDEIIHMKDGFDSSREFNYSRKNNIKIYEESSLPFLSSFNFRAHSAFRSPELFEKTEWFELSRQFSKQGISFIIPLIFCQFFFRIHNLSTPNRRYSDLILSLIAPSV